MIGKMAIIATALVGLLVPAMAQDSTTTTTTTTPAPQPAPAPAPGVFVGVPGVAGVQIGSPPAQGGCTTRSTTSTDNNTGASTSTTATNC
jgi:hypothetical protein